MPNQELARAGTVGRYHAVEELGRGAMGIVYKGYDPVIGRHVALKTIAFSDNDQETREFRRRLYSEASAAGALAHPNIVTIYDIIEQGGITAIAMEFVEGWTLAALIHAEGQMTVERALELFEPLCAGLDYAGERGIVHRDIKPANILVGADGRPKIADFGIARMLSSNATMTGMVMGSPGYMSPEQVRGLTLDRRSDLFAAATIFYELLTNLRPFTGDDAATTMYRIVHEPHVPVHHVNPAVDPRIGAVLDRALAKEPDDRYQTGEDLVASLRAAIAAPAAAAAVTPPSRRFAIAGGIAALAATAAVAVFLWNQFEPASASVPAAASAPPVATSSSPAAPPVATSSPAAAPAATAPAATAPAGTPKGAAAKPRTESPALVQRASAPREAAFAADRPVSAVGGAGMLDVVFDGEPFPVTVYAGGTPIGRLEGPGAVPAPPGDVRVRAVSESVFFDRDFGAVRARPGERRGTLQLPGLASAVMTVTGEIYSGLRIFVDERSVPGPYPAQIARLAAGPHAVRFTWVAGPLSGRQLRQEFEARAGGHLLIRAVPDADQVLVQTAR